MTISDGDLTIFAVGVSSVAGVILAILVSMLIFIRGRIISNERDGLAQVEDAAGSMYQILLGDSPQACNYFGGVPTYDAFMGLISPMYGAHSVEDIPDFFSWRIRSNDILKISQEQEKLTLHSLALRGFHTRFVAAMRQVDRAVQFIFTAVVFQRRISETIRWAIWSAALLLGTGVPIALISSTRSNQGLPDSLNIIVASLLLLVFLSLIGFVLWLTRLLMISGSASLDKEVEKRVGKEALAAARTALAR